MAAKHVYRQGFLLLLLNFICTAALEKRFSDFKRCADEECSMLLVRGKALKDFTGPDCRFLPVKASETIYVYYKLSGRRDDMWAGSVGSHFGYFPKDLMAVNHWYTDKEVEVPAEETDFVCFDTGLDKFNTYDVDLLLGSSLEENDNENKVSSDQLDVSETETQTSADEETDSEIPDDQSASIPELDVATDATERASEHREEGSKTKDTSSSEGRQIPKLKTTFGTTFDAVTSNDEITKNVTPYDSDDEEEGEVMEHHPEDDEDVEEGTPLLSFSEQNVNTPTSDSLKTSEGVQIPKLKTTFGSTFDAVISNDEITENVTPYDSDDEEEGEVMEHHPEDDEDVEEGTPLLSFSEQIVNAPSSDSLKTSEGVQIPKLKTTFGSTFDAVTSDDEITKKVTPYVEEEGEDEEYVHEDDSDVEVGTPLLSFSEQNVNSPSSDSPKTEEELVTKEDVASENQPRVTISEGRQIPDLKTTFGTTFDAVITNEEITKKVTPYEEEESEDVENLPEDDSDVVVGTPFLSFAEPTMNIPSSDSPKTSEGRQIPKLKTTFGMTLDAVITNEEITKKVTPHEEVESEDVEHPFEDDVDVKAGTPLLSFAKQTINMPSSDSLKTSEGRQIPKLKTTFGTTFDAVTSNEEITKKVTPYDEEESEGVEHPPEDDTAVKEETPLLSFSEKNVNSPTNDDKPGSVEEKNIWTSFGDAVFSAITGVEKTSQDVSSDEDEEDEEEAASKTPPTFDQIKKAFDSSSSQTDIKETDSEDDDEGDVEEVGPEDTWEETLEPTEEPIHHQTEESKTSVDLESEVTSSDNDDDEKTADDSLPNQIHDHESTDLESNKSKPEILLEEAENHEEDENTNTAVMKEELLEDENAVSVSELDNKDSDEPLAETVAPAVSTPEPEYSDSVLRLTLLRDHFSEEEMERIQKLLGLKNLFKVEAMFSDLDTELQVTRLSHTGTTQDMENALEGILEASENTILDEVEKMLDSRDTKPNYDQNVDTSKLDEETEILDDFQELAFSLRQKYSTASDSTPLATEQGSDIGQDKHELNATDEMPHIVEKGMVDIVLETEGNDRHPVTDNKERPTETKEELIVLDEVHSGPDVSVKEDGGHFNKNKYNQPGFSGSEEMPRVPQATLENPLDRGLGVEVEQSPSGSLESIEPVSKIQEEVGLFSTGVVYMGCILSMIKTKIAEWTIMVISLLPEEWKPGETLFGCPWQAVIVTALIGVMTFTLFFWRTVLAVKKREYLVDDKKLTEQMQALKKEKNDALTKMSELQKQTEQLKEHQKESNKSVSSTMKRMQVLESTVLEAETRNEKIVAEKDKYAKLLKDERANSQQHEARIAKLEKSNEKLQLSRKKIQEAFAKTAVLLDEAKIREDARNVQHKCLEKDHGALKEENKSLKANIKGWESKHKELNEQIKVYQKSQKELEDSVVLKDHNVEVLSELLADLDACDSQKGESKVLANGEIAADKKTAIKNRIKQMMDVSRVHTTLTVVEEERDRFMTKLLNEEKARKSMEEQHQELEHAIATLKREKSHVETQFTILQQKNEIMVEMYQQKENALQQRLTKEELERRSKESMLSEVGGKALEAEEQVKVLRQRINEMEDQMKKTEVVYKDQIKEQENKTHSNWVTARNAERALNQEKLETSKLREKLVVLTSQLNERRAPLFRPNSGQPTGPRQGDSYGPSPVSGGAPSPPIMIEGPRRPPSAPVGRRIDPYGPRPPSDPHGRYADSKHIPSMDMMGPRSSSPSNMDGSTKEVEPQINEEAQAEASTDSPEPGPGSFLASPIRDSPGPMVPGPGPHDQFLPPGPHGRLPPPGPYRPRPGLYHHGPPGPNVPPLHGPPLPANGHPGMPMPGPMGGEFGPRPNGHAYLPRPGPGQGPLPPHFRPPPPHHFGPMPPPHGIRGPMGPRPPFPPDMRFPGPREHSSLPPGVPPHPAHPGEAYGQPPLNALHNSSGPYTGPQQDAHVKQEAPQDSTRPSTVKP